MKQWFFLFLFYTLTLVGKSAEIETLYSRLDPQSLSKLFAFYHLYPDTEEGKQGLSKAFGLINKHRSSPIDFQTIPLCKQMDVESFVSTFTKQPEEKQILLSSEEIHFIDKISSHLKHLHLFGHNATTTEQLLCLPSEEIDIARAVFLAQFGADQLDLIKSYEASLDLFALCILGRLDKNPSPRDIIEKISYFVFYEMMFRFPPHSLWINDVDQYTYLPSILDSHHGVCLGVSILYLSLAQRLGVSLDIYTPPGHIYLGHTTLEDGLNIETTARGIHIPTKHYLSIQTKHVQKRTLKEVVGMHHFNAAASLWQTKNYPKAIDEYQKALAFIPNDPLTESLLAFNYLLSGEKKKGEALLKKIKDVRCEGSILKNTLIEDYLLGNCDEKGIALIYDQVDESRESILKKQGALKTYLHAFPKFREGLFHLATTFLQLGRKKEALEVLTSYHNLYPLNPIVEYYLTHLHFVRLNPTQAKRHFKGLESILNEENHHPDCIKELKMLLKTDSLL